MRTIRAATSVLVLLALVAPSAASSTPSSGQQPDQETSPVRARAASFDGDLRSLPTVPGRSAVEVPRGGLVGEDFTGSTDGGRDPTGGAAGGPESLGPTLPQFATPSISVDGQPGAVPPDPIGDVGPSHYLQAVNVSFAVYSKASGGLVAGPANINSLWAGVGGQCEANNSGDPVVLYDQWADRFILAQFTAPLQDELCFAVSKTSNPVTGGWWLYEFSTGVVFPDYFKVGVWPNGYYVAWNQGTTGVAALQRSAMLSGGPAWMVIGSPISGPLGSNMMLPADADGGMQPPAGRRNPFYRFVDGDVHGGIDRIELYEVQASFGSPPSISVTGPASIPVAPFSSEFCGETEFVFCIPQPGTSQKLDPIMEWPMWRLQYRNFGIHEALVGNFTVDVNGADRAGIRWFELRRKGTGGWQLHQQGTLAPGTSEHRWMGSVALNGRGHMALGYSVSASADTFPSVRYAGRLASDPSGTLTQGEVELATGTSSQTTSGRWGDYASMNVDPSDDCTFWFTGEYHAGGSRRTRIGAFKLCTPTSKTVTLKARPTTVASGGITRLVARVRPCAGHAGHRVLFQQKRGGWKTFARVKSNANCVAKRKLKVTRKVVLRALSPKQDTDHGAGASTAVRVRVT